MTKVELQNKKQQLLKEVNQKYPAVFNNYGDTMIKVVEHKGVKYELDYMFDTYELISIYKHGDTYSKQLRRGQKDYTYKELTSIISSLKSILKGTEIQDGPILQVVENDKTIPYYSATIRFECEIDAQSIFGVFSKLNNWSLRKSDGGYVVLIDEYKGSRTVMGNPTAKLTISSEYDINDIKAILLNFDEELPDCHVAIQSLDYSQFDGMRDRSSHYPTDGLVELWSNKLGNLKKVA